MNSEIVSFPNLGLKFSLNTDAFSIFGITIKWYAIIIALGFLLAFIFVMKKAKAFGLDSDKVFDIVIFGTIGGIIGARLYFVAFKWDYYSKHLNEIFSTREGGLAIYGGIIGAVLVAFFVARMRKVKFIPLLDMASIGFLIGQGIGRWGNFVNREAYGGATSQSFIFGMNSPSIAQEVALEQGIAYDPNVLVHPCFLYESIWCILGAVVLILFIKHRKFDGEIGLLYCLWYGLERAMVEGLRTDSLYIPNTQIRVSQALSLILALTAAIILVIIYCIIHKNRVTLNNHGFMMLYSNTEQSKKILDEAIKKQIHPEKTNKHNKSNKDDIVN